MSSENIRPSTLDGIKRLAKSIKTERAIQHAVALDESARLAGFENFRHARNKLQFDQPKTHKLRNVHRVFLTVYWRDKKTDIRGRETLELHLSTLWSDLIQPVHFQNHRAMANFRREGPDHLAKPELADSQSRARYYACAAARALQFMDATKLRPSKSHSRAYPGGRSSNAVPAHDHESVWYDPETKRYLYVDEPYETAVELATKEREAWAIRHGFTIMKPTWPGMYFPDGGSRLFLIADSQKGIPLAPVVAALERLPAPIVEATWDGESASSLPYFISPGTIEHAKAIKLPPQKPSKPTTGKRNTVGYVQTFVGAQRRPNGTMPVETHAKVGELLKSVLVASYHRKGVYNRVDGIRSELDEWTMREYNRAELPSEVFFDLYYHESGNTYERSLSENERLKHTHSLEEVKRILAAHYPDSKPLRTVLNKVEGAIKSMQTWGA
jgi:hypothetical protein